MINKLLLVPMVIGLGACTVGPDFQSPDTDLPSQWQTDVSASMAPDQAAIDGQWWEKLGDPQLIALVQRAQEKSFDAQSAFVNLEKSRALLQVARADRLPQVDMVGGYQSARSSHNGLVDPSGLGGQAPYEKWSAAADASWEVDLWGRVRRIVEGAQAQLQLTQAQRDGVLLSVSAETASNYIRLRGVQTKIKVLISNLEIAERTSSLTQNRFDNGVTTNLDTANASAQVEAVRANLPQLKAEQERLINALSFLVGAAPRALGEELHSPRAIPNPAPDAPVGLPSDLARRRPDIRASEAELHKATAAIGVAEADFYPRVTIGASAGFEALTGGDLGDWGSRQWSVGPTFYLPIFQGGRLTAQLAIRKREQQVAAIDYQRTVMRAWHEVDDAMTAYAAEKERHESLNKEVLHNTTALRAAEERYRQGAIDYLNVLSVQRALLASQNDLADSAVGAALERVKLYKALGGSWSTPDEGLASRMKDMGRATLALGAPHPQLTQSSAQH